MKHLPGIFRVNCDTPNSLASLMQKDEVCRSLLGWWSDREKSMGLTPVFFSENFPGKFMLGHLSLSWHGPCFPFLFRPVIFTVDMAHQAMKASVVNLFIEACAGLPVLDALSVGGVGDCFVGPQARLGVWMLDVGKMTGERRHCLNFVFEVISPPCFDWMIFWESGKGWKIPR